MTSAITQLNPDTIRLINSVVILSIGTLVAWLVARFLSWLVHKVKWDQKIASKLKGRDADSVLRTIRRVIFWPLLFTIIVIAAGELAGIQAIAEITTALDNLVIRLSSNFLAMLILRVVVLFLLSLLFVFLWRRVRRGAEWLANRVDRYREKRLKTLKIQDLELLSRSRISKLIHAIIKYSSWLVHLLLVIIYLSAVSLIFPAIRPLLGMFLAPVWAAIGKALSAFIAWLPNLFYLVLISLGGYYLTRLARYFFRELGKGSVKIKGFYPEWSEPTYQLVRVFIIALTLVFAFPFIPGSSSPAFQGVTVFLGLLISLGSTSVIANIMAGIVLTYTHAFSIGDRVQIGATTGDVIDRSLLVTTVRTIKNEDVTIPNNVVLSGHIVNYTQEVERQGLILYTSVTIGYDTPWREVHKALLAAAMATPDILETPEPFVLQTALNDFFVSYQINAYTKDPERMAAIYSALHQNIQDKFNEAGLEILSPHYTQLRDGNKKAVPEEYLPKGYKTPGLRIEKG
jgi:small-conductance mechanosensitive channel